jgi:hypothetical protein
MSNVLSSRISTKHSNEIKLALLDDFIAKYRTAVEIYVDYIWNNSIVWDNRTSDISKQLFDIPQFLSTTNIEIETDLSARVLKCAMTQACGMVKGALKEIPKFQRIIIKNQKLGRDVSKLQSKYDKLLTKLKVPYCRNVYPELNSLCAQYSNTDKSFDGFLTLSSLGKKYGKIEIPVNLTKHFIKLQKYAGKTCSSFLIKRDCIHFRYKYENINIKKVGSTEGADQGAKTCLTLSDGQTTKKDIPWTRLELDHEKIG